MMMWSFFDIAILLFFNFGLLGLGLLGYRFITKRWSKLITSHAATAPLLNAAGFWVVGFGVASVLVAIAGLVNQIHMATWSLLSLGLLNLLYRMRGVSSLDLKFSRIQWILGVITFLFILSGICLLGLMYSELSLTKQIQGVSGMGNWAYKAKLIYHDQGIHSDYFSVHAHNYGKFSYPPGHPLMSSMLSCIAGEFTDGLLKKQSIVMLVGLFGLLSFSFIKNWRWFGFIAILGLGGIFLGNGAWSVTYWFYAEPLLWVCSAVAIFAYLNQQLFLSILCAVSAAWVKNEGLVLFFCLGVSMIFLYPEKKKGIIISSLLGLLPILVWKGVVWSHGVSDSDFDFSWGNYQYSNIKTAFDFMKKITVNEWFNYSGMIVLLPVTMIWFSLMKKWHSLFACLTAFFFIVIFMCSMAWSVLDDIEWHLTSTIRYMMLPAFIVVSTLASHSPFPIPKHE